MFWMLCEGELTGSAWLGNDHSCRYAGKFFTFDLLDEGRGEIRAVAFGAEAERFEPLVPLGNIVQISKARRKPKRKNVR